MLAHGTPPQKERPRPGRASYHEVKELQCLTSSQRDWSHSAKAEQRGRGRVTDEEKSHMPKTLLLKSLATALLLTLAGGSASIAQMPSYPNGIPIQPTTPPNIANPGLTNGPPDMQLPRSPAPSPTYSPSATPSTSPMLGSTRSVYPRRYVVRPNTRGPVANTKRGATKSAKASRKTNNARADFGVRDICRGC